jgi:adenylate cyclase
VRDHLLNGNIKLGGEIRIATILFCDLRGFTSLSEQLSPIQIVEMLNTHFETMSKCIEEEGGLINKFIGDAIMAIYNVPVARQNHAERAFISARRMLESLELMNSGFQKRGLPELKIGIGLHTGEVLAGNIGSSSRLEYTVIGDTVNVASRIESLCKETKRSLLVSEATKAQLPVNTPLDSLGAFQLKGREEMIQIFAG